MEDIKIFENPLEIAELKAMLMDEERVNKGLMAIIAILMDGKKTLEISGEKIHNMILAFDKGAKNLAIWNYDNTGIKIILENMNDRL